MGENSKISWTHHTFNPWMGCAKVSAACANCYAETWAKRSGLVKWGADAERRRTSEAKWKEPLKWNRQASLAKERQRVFCASLADVFEDHPSIMPGWRAELGALIRSTPWLDWLLLTKRPENVLRLLPDFWVNFSGTFDHLPHNVWIGTTCENQEQADRRIPELLKIPARVRFLSCEPLLEMIDISPYLRCESCLDPLVCWCSDPKVHWVIVGGESGPNARPMHPDWARSLRDQCKVAGVPFHFKQWGEWAPCGPIQADPEFYGGGAFADPWSGGHAAIGLIERTPSRYRKLSDQLVMVRAGKAKTGRLLDGVVHDEFPEVK